MSRDPPDRPVYVGNFEYSAEERDIRQLMEKYGEVIRIDMKQGFAFCYFAREDDGNYAIRKLDGTEWGYKRRPLRLEWAKQRDSERKREVRPNTNLFIVNFDTTRTRTRDLERAFEPFGRLRRVEIKRNYGFVEYENLDDAAYALKKMNGSELDGRTLTVEYVANVDGGARGEGRGRSRSRSRSPPRRGSPPRRYSSRSRSPPRRRPSRSRSPPRRGSPSLSPPPPRRGSPAARSPSPARRDRSRSR